MSIDLSTEFGGLWLRSPIIVGACPMTANAQNRVAIENAGAGAVVLPSLLEEHVIAWKARHGRSLDEREQRLLENTTKFAKDTLIPDVETYLSIVNRASVQSSLPIIASLNGQSDGDWLDFAGELQAAGASAIELNIHHRNVSDYDDPRQLEDQVVELAKTINESITVPLFLKLHREYASVGHLARRLVSGAQGLILYARDPEINIALDSLELETSWELTPPGDISETLRGVMSVYNLCPAMPLVASGGIGRPKDLIKVLLGGADAGAIVSAVYREGPDVIRIMRDGLIQFMESHRFSSLNEIQPKRPLESSNEEERIKWIKGLSVQPMFVENENSVVEHVIKADKWGHPVNAL